MFWTSCLFVDIGLCEEIKTIFGVGSTIAEGPLSYTYCHAVLICLVNYFGQYFILNVCVGVDLWSAETEVSM